MNRESGLQRLPAHPLMTLSETSQKIDPIVSLLPSVLVLESARWALMELGNEQHRFLGSEILRGSVWQRWGGHLCLSTADRCFPVCQLCQGSAWFDKPLLLPQRHGQCKEGMRRGGLQPQSPGDRSCVSQPVPIYVSGHSRTECEGRALNSGTILRASKGEDRGVSALVPWGSPGLGPCAFPMISEHRSQFCAQLLAGLCHAYCRASAGCHDHS